MKCPECAHNHQRGKHGTTCTNCKYKFVFDPKDSETFGITDGKFLALIRQVSRNDTYWFTREQLYAHACRKSFWGRFYFGCAVAAGVVLLFVAGNLYLEFVAGAQRFWWAFAAFAACSAIVVIPWLIALGHSLVPPEPERMLKLLRHWYRADRTIDKLLTEPTLHDPPPEAEEPDIYDYGVERLLIVERDILVDLFVRNELHAQERMLVIAESGYPEYLLPVAQRLLAENPELPVFLLHDATTAAPPMEERILDAGKLPIGGHKIVDLGLFPETVRRMKGMKKLALRRHDYQAPVDYLLFSTLAGGIAQAMVMGAPLAVLMESVGDEASNTTVGDFG